MTAKTSISREELALIVLNRVRAEDGLHDVQEISISEINDPDAGSNWRATTLDKDRADTSRIIIVIERLQDELRQMYTLDPGRHG